VRRAGEKRALGNAAEEEKEAPNEAGQSDSNTNSEEGGEESEPWEDLRLGFPIQSLPRPKSK
jgi:hypothetical protein